MATPFRLKRSSVTGKRPALADVQIGELAFNFYDGHLFAERDTGGVGIATTVALLTPWIENFGGGSITYNGIVTATTYHGNQVIGTPAGGFKSGAFTINNTDHTKDSINELNFILGKLVPAAPDTFNGLAFSLTGTAGNGRLCQGFTPTNNTGGSAPSAGTQYTRNTDSTITSNYINDVGPGDNGTVTGFVNSGSVGAISLDTNVNNGTNGAIQIADNKDASNSTRNTGITSQFYQVYDVRFLNAASPDGYNKAFFTHGSATSGEVFWYEDPSTVGAPVISFSGVTEPPVGSAVTAHSSGIPHYTNNASNSFSYVMTVTNASGDMYTQNRLVAAGNNNSKKFSSGGNKNYNNFAGGTHPPTKNFGVGTGVTTLVSHIPKNNVHTTVTNSHFHNYVATTPYGSDSETRSYGTYVNIMSGTPSNVIDEDNISSTVGNGNNGTRVKAGASGDNPTASYATWTGGSAGLIDTYEAAVRGGVLRHDQTNYSTGYLPVGPNYSTGRSGAQYYQVMLQQQYISSFNIVVTGSYGGCWVCMPNNSNWMTGLSNTNGWADMFTAYGGSGAPRNVAPGCAVGTVMSGSNGTFTCTFGTETSSNASSPYRILIRWKLDAGDSITAMSYTT